MRVVLIKIKQEKPGEESIFTESFENDVLKNDIIFDNPTETKQEPPYLIMVKDEQLKNDLTELNLYTEINKNEDPLNVGKCFQLVSISFISCTKLFLSNSR